MGSTIQLTVTVFPEDATVDSLLWSSSNEGVDTVDDNGLIKALSEGITTISVSISNNPDVNTSVEISVIGEAGISDIIQDGEEVSVYNLTGTLVLKTRNKEALNSLLPGLYIINGKKVMISK